MLIGGLITSAVKALMHISFFLDTVIYRIAGWSFKVFYVMGGITLDADETVQLIINKIYTILLIFMVFVVAYNMLLYIINPDKIQHTDKTPGASDLVKRIAISLIVIVAFPLLFDVLYDVQRDIVEYNVIGTIILGGASESSDMDPDSTCVVSGVGASGDALVADVYSSFLYPLNGLEASDCCNGTLSEEEIQDDTVIGNYCTAYLDARDKGAIGAFSEIKNAAIKDDTDYQYLGIVSSLAGVIMAVYFLGFCINLGVRLFKLLALELVAPIPALMDLIPGKSGTLGNWFKEVFKVYMQVFIYQAIVFSMVWLATLIPGLLSQVNDSINATASGVSNGFILLAKVLLIMALFQGAKEIPKMLSDVLGIKGDGSLLKTVGLRGMNMFAGAGALAFGAASNFAKSYKGSGGSLLSAGAGALGSLRRNAWGMRNAKNFKDIKASTKASTEATQNKRIKRSAYYQAHKGDATGVKAAWNVAKARGQDAWQSTKNFADDNFGIKDKFAKNMAKDEALSGYDKIYKEQIESLWKSDAAWADYDEKIKRVKAGEKVLSHKDADGNDVYYTEEDLKRLQSERKADILSKNFNQNKVRAALAEMKAYAATHADVDGIHKAYEFDKNGKFDMTKEITGDFVEQFEVSLGKIKKQDYVDTKTAKELERLRDEIVNNGSTTIGGRTYDSSQFAADFYQIKQMLDAQYNNSIDTTHTLKGEIDALADDKEYQAAKSTLTAANKAKEAVAAKQKSESTSASEKQSK